VPTPRDSVFEREIHARMLKGDPTASEEVARRYLPIIATHLRINGLAKGIQDPDVINDAAVDAVIGYILHPEKFDPLKSGLLGYLKRAADMDLINETQKHRRRRRGEELYDDVEFSILHRNKASEVDRIRGNAEDEAIRHLEAVETDELLNAGNDRDNRLLELLRIGERSTSVFAAVLKVENLPIAEQRRIVKQHKDRLKLQFKRKKGIDCG